ncbi:zinc finger protein yan [Diplodia corticola]|uniref:Zinc finger protein yan n=1 Tax=Diplodia corticola TaxID=236234 RepID=A0A1J9RGH9_9PEZI|nr:zinc finger protein yan [Diplodia corticola]OJD40646.1 zinc finger protein yan [Diplodia corticola]
MASTPASAFACNTCSTAFDDGQIQQRAHVRDPWHQYNIQRRIASLPPITQQQFESNVQPTTAPVFPKNKHANGKISTGPTNQKHRPRDKQPPFPSPSSDSGTEVIDPDRDAPRPCHSPSISSDFDDEDEDEESESESPPVDLSPTTCLFCPSPSPTPAANLAHMSTAHGLFVPSPAQLIDLDTFLLYLAALVHRHHECLYCAAAFASAAAAQTHMRDKGHCMINLDEDVEGGLLDFWEFDDEDDGDEDDENDDDREGGAAGAAGGAPVSVSDTEMRLPSGAIVGSRHHAESGVVHGRHGLVGARAQAAKRRTRLAIAEGGEAEGEEDADARPQQQQTASSSRDRRVAVRGEMGLVGVPEQQRRALVAVEKKMMKREAVARAAQRWATEKVANRQKFFKPDVPGRKNG